MADTKSRARTIVRRLKKHYPDATCALHHSSPFELLIATILSAQCTDERVNIVTRDLFRKYRRPEDYLAVEPEELEKDIFSTGFYRNKTKSIRGACRILLENFGGEMPRTIEEMLTIPGVARKTANVVLGVAFGIATGIVVDTHVGRVSRRLGLTEHEDPEKVERDLVALVPKRDWIDFGHLVITHGRRICAARVPACDACFLTDLCPYYAKVVAEE